jgi:glycine C-acetyltransferase/8-amino-7-oxononanoate synthase
MSTRAAKTATGGEAFEHSLADYSRPQGRNLLDRTRPYGDWVEARRAAGVWPFMRRLGSPPGPEATVVTPEGERREYLNFGTQDYLGLTSHPAVRAAATEAVAEFGPHSAGSGALLGNSTRSAMLAERLAQLVGMEHLMLFPTGWAAGYGAIVGLVRPYDYVLMDKLAHACLQAGAYAATPRVVRYDHASIDAAREALGKIRGEDARAGILVITEGLFSLDSDYLDIAKLQEVCREHDAILLVDLAHDLGSLGPGGTGQLGVQGIVGEVDLVMGSFSKTFASNGGFLAAHEKSVVEYAFAFSNSGTFSNGLSPIQASVVLAAVDIITSAEGDELRAQLLRVVDAVRGRFAEEEIHCLGEPSALIPVPLGNDAAARYASKLVRERGVLANLFEFPGVEVGSARFRMQAMARHTVEQGVEAATIVSGAIRDARSEVEG